MGYKNKDTQREYMKKLMQRKRANVTKPSTESDYYVLLYKLTNDNQPFLNWSNNIHLVNNELVEEKSYKNVIFDYQNATPIKMEESERRVLIIRA